MKFAHIIISILLYCSVIYGQTEAIKINSFLPLYKYIYFDQKYRTVSDKVLLLDSLYSYIEGIDNDSIVSLDVNSYRLIQIKLDTIIRKSSILRKITITEKEANKIEYLKSREYYIRKTKRSKQYLNERNKILSNFNSLEEMVLQGNVFSLFCENKNYYKDYLADIKRVSPYIYYCSYPYVDSEGRVIIQTRIYRRYSDIFYDRLIATYVFYYDRNFINNILNVIVYINK
jgi:hypothetical protein